MHKHGLPDMAPCQLDCSTGFSSQGDVKIRFLDGLQDIPMHFEHQVAHVQDLAPQRVHISALLPLVARSL